MRIVCLVPSLSETLCDLGLQFYIVGCTNYCIEPKDLKLKSVMVGGTKDASLDKILALNPTHILVNLEENSKEIVEALRLHSSKFKVIETFPKNVSDVINMLRFLGNSFDNGTEAINRAHYYIDEIKIQLQKIKQTNWTPIPYSYFIWRRPWMAAGANTYIHSILSEVGLVNVVPERYPQIDLLPSAPYLKLNSGPLLQTPQVCLFSSEPYPFRDRDMTDFLSETQSNIICVKVDGKNLSWHGTRTLLGLKYAHQLSLSLRSGNLC